ncbi:MAG: hypothetical protein H6744_07520 [Deltaproteobacteria bacterium]|nr:hypothetical protein [Deltaproteobacteria bacterium]MCB9786529.1 hypothetical protein [Deltaproteobacteria bacterium]
MRAATLVFVLLGSTLLAAAPSAPARADLVSVYAGVGPRFRADAIDAVGTAHVGVPLGIWLDLTLEAHAFLGGADRPMHLAGGNLGVLFSPPIPGPIGVQAGVDGGFAVRTLARHGTDDVVPLFAAEVALIGEFGPARLRLAYQHTLGRDDKPSRDAVRSQLLVMLGFGI